MAYLPRPSAPQRLALAVALASPLLASSLQAEEQGSLLLPELKVEDELQGPYQTEQLSSPKFTQPLLDTPQTVNVVNQQLMREQGVKTLRDALRNVTGISMQAGEGNPPSGDQLKIRGFSVRDDILVDGVRDVGNYFRDPFNVEQIEVIKGPSSTFAGRGAAGGVVNLVTKAPQLDDFSDIETSLGTDATQRLTADFNRSLDQLEGAALRLNLMHHEANVADRDHVQYQRWGIAPSLALGLDGDTRLTLGYFHMTQNNRPDGGIPNTRNPSLAGSSFEGGQAPVDFDNYYGYRNDYQDLGNDQFSVKFEHDFNDQLSLHNISRWSRTENDSIFSSPRFTTSGLTTIDANTLVRGNRKPRDQVDSILANQTDLTWRFATGGLQHSLVSGIEVTRQDAENKRRLDANGPSMNLFEPDLIEAPEIPYNGTRATIDTDTLALYVQDSIELNRHWELNAGLRWDKVESTVEGKDDSGNVPGYLTSVSGTDEEPSGSLGLVYKPQDNGSIYLAYGTSFETSGRYDIVQLAGGNNNPPTTAEQFNVDPEQSESYELGSKWELLDRQLSLAAALFRIDKTNARTPGDAGQPAVVLDGKQRVDGLELSASGRLSEDWALYAGYTYMDGRIEASNFSAEEGRRLDNLPRNSFSAWTSYQLTPELSVGLGAEHVDERLAYAYGSAANLTVSADAYTVYNAVGAYRFSPQVAVQLNLYNLADEEYVSELAHGQSIPGAGRSALVTGQFSF